MSHSGTHTYNQIQTLHSNAHTLTLSRTITFRIHTCIHTLCSHTRQRGGSLHHTLGRIHIHQRYKPYTLTRGKHTHYLQNTYTRDTSCHILVQEDHFVTTSTTHTSEIHHAIYSSRRITSSHPQEHIHQRYYTHSLPRGTHTHYLHDRYIRDTMHLDLHGANILTTSTTDLSEILCIWSYTGQTYSLPPKHIHQRYIASTHG